MRLLVAAALLGAFVLLLAGCGSSGAKPNGEAEKAPVQILVDAEAASETGRSVHVAWHYAQNRGDVRLVAGEGGTGRLTGGATTLDFVLIGGNAYVKGTPFWRSVFGGTPADRWFEMPPRLVSDLWGNFHATTDLGRLVRGLHLTEVWTGTLKKTMTTLRGQEAVAVTGVRGTVFVATTGKPYLLEVDIKTSSVSFDGWDAPVALKAPPSAVRLSQAAQAAATWSTWRPSPASPQKVAVEIADHVAPRYRISTNGGVAVIASKPQVTSGKRDIAIEAVTITGAPQSNTGVPVSSANRSELFTFCGLGPFCTIAQGRPSVSRGRLVRREALEVALYTFKFVPAVDAVIAFLPPSWGETRGVILYLRRTDLKSALNRSLSKTLPLATPPLPTDPDKAESAMIDGLTLPHLYTYSFVALPAGGAALVLNPVR